MNFYQWDKNVMLKYGRDNPHNLRLGQLYTNELSAHNLELFRKVPSDIDPYYFTSRLPDFLQWVSGNWQDT